MLAVACCLQRKCIGKALGAVLIVCGARRRWLQVGTSINAQPEHQQGHLAGFGGVHNVPGRSVPLSQVAILLTLRVRSANGFFKPRRVFVPISILNRLR